eukprot:scaffold360_cov374-Pavlova_lutheri.AAC.6
MADLDVGWTWKAVGDTTPPETLPRSVSILDDVRRKPVEGRASVHERSFDGPIAILERSMAVRTSVRCTGMGPGSAPPSVPVRVHVRPTASLRSIPPWTVFGRSMIGPS